MKNLLTKAQKNNLKLQIMQTANKHPEFMKRVIEVCEEAKKRRERGE